VTGPGGPDIDWSLTTWEGTRRDQLRRSIALTLRERLEAVEEMARLSERLQRMRETYNVRTDITRKKP
jgi:CRISPR-associated protein Csx17